MWYRGPALLLIACILFAPTKPVSVFISYSSQDARAAHSISSELTQAGCTVESYESLARAGNHWMRDVEKAIDAADIILTLVSPASYRSDWVRAESLRAQRKGKRIVPVLLAPDTDIPLVLEGLQRSTREALRKLCR